MPILIEAKKRKKEHEYLRKGEAKSTGEEQQVKKQRKETEEMKKENGIDATETKENKSSSSSSRRCFVFASGVWDWIYERFLPASILLSICQKRMMLCWIEKARRRKTSGSVRDETSKV